MESKIHTGEMDYGTIFLASGGSWKVVGLHGPSAAGSQFCERIDGPGRGNRSWIRGEFEVAEDEAHAAYLASLPPIDEAEERYYAELEAEDERLRKIPRVNGCEAVKESGTCESCGASGRVVYARDAITLGYAGHPGAEVTVFQICEPCLTSGDASGRRSRRAFA